MQVLHINCNYITTAFHQTMVEKLSDLGYENKVYVPTYRKNLAVIKPNANVIISECFQRCDRIIFDYKQLKIRKDIQYKINIADYDCIHAHTLFTDGNCAMNLSKKYHVPYIVAIRNTDVNDFFKNMLHLRKRGIRIMKNAKAIIFLSETYRQLVFKKYVPDKYKNELAAKSYIIPNGIDDFWLKNINETNIAKKLARLNHKTLKIIYAGRIDRNKNILTVQKALAILRTKGYKTEFTIVGKIEDEAVFQQIKNDEFTIYIPSQPKEELIRLYRENDIFVMPSFHETFGLVYAEAMSQGLPVIYSKGQGFDGQFKEGLVGYHVNAENCEEIANAVEFIISQYNFINKNVLKESYVFNWNNIVNKYSQIYASLLLTKKI